MEAGKGGGRGGEEMSEITGGEVCAIRVLGSWLSQTIGSLTDRSYPTSLTGLAIDTSVIASAQRYLHPLRTASLA